MVNPCKKKIHPVPNSALRPSRTGGDSQKAHGQLWEVESEPGTLGGLMGNWWDFAVVSTLLFLLNTALENDGIGSFMDDLPILTNDHFP